MCQREKCLACDQPNGFPLPGCSHDRLERHELLPSRSSSPTLPIPNVMSGSIEVDLADTENAAQFLEMVARVIREKKKIRVTIE